MTREAWNKAIARLTAAFPQREISTATILAYREHLIGMDGALFAAAVEQCMDTCDWFPTISQLLKASDGIAARAHGILPPEQAWEHVLDVARGWHDGLSVRAMFDEATFAALQRIGGMRTVATADDHGTAAKRRDFLLSYQRSYEMQIADMRGLPLPDAPAGMARLRDGQAA